jgi:hypothetical protein
MGRGERARRARLWIALPGGVAINGLLLASLILFERPLPLMEDPPAVALALERPEVRRRTPPRPPSRTTSEATASATPRSTSASAPAAEVSADPPRAAPAGLAVDPGWAVDGGAYLTPESAARARRAWNAAQERRYKRACVGLSSEHMTDEEKDRCYGGWNQAAEEAGASRGEPLALDAGKQGRFDAQVRQQDRCRAYQRRALPGTAPVESPRLRDGGCL